MRKNQILTLAILAVTLIYAGFFGFNSEEKQLASASEIWTEKIGDAYMVPACASSGGSGGGGGTGSTGGSPTLDADFVTQNVPPTLMTGELKEVAVRMKNCRPSGDCSNLNTWTQSESYRLGSQNPQDNNTWSNTRANLPVSSVAPGSAVTFAFNIRAPLTPGTYNFQRRMLQEGVTWFGEFTQNVPINVIASGYIAGRIWHDLNGDGNFDAGEPFIREPANACSGSAVDNIFARRVSGPTSFNMEATRCNADGPYYVTDRIVAGEYVVSTGLLPNGWIQTSPNVTIKVTNGGVSTAWFGVAKPGIIKGRIFNDLDGDGAEDVGEPRIQDIGVNCANGNNFTLDNVKVSNTAGPDSFSVEPTNCGTDGANWQAAVAPGTYELTITPPVGWQVTTAKAISGISVTSGATSGGNVFGVWQPGIIRGRIFNDLDGDTVRDSGEPLLRDPANSCSGAPLSVTVKSLSGTTPFNVSLAQCDGTGPLYKTEVLPGTYNMTTALPVGWQQTTADQTRTVSAGVTVDAWFGVMQLGTIQGRVFNDLDKDGVEDVGEPRIQDVGVNCTNGINFTLDNVKISNTVGPDLFNVEPINCGVNGTNWKVSVAPGTYNAVISPPSGWVVTTAPTISNISVTSGVTSGGYAFGIATTVVNPPPTVTLTANPTAITSGGSSLLTWSSTNATACSASGGWSGSKTLSGTQSVSPVVDTTYTLTCTGPGGPPAVDSVTITVSASIPLTANLKVNGGDHDTSADALSVPINSPVTFGWTSTGPPLYECRRQSSPAVSSWNAPNVSKNNSSFSHTVSGAAGIYEYIFECTPTAGNYSGFWSRFLSWLGLGNVLASHTVQDSEFINVTAAPLPDLTATLNALPAMTTGASVSFSGKVSNAGSANAGSFVTRFCIDNPSCLTSSVGQIGAPPVASLAAGATTANLNSNSWTATGGPHTLYFCADTGSAVSESNESNNCATSVNFTVSAGTGDVLIKRVGSDDTVGTAPATNAWVDALAPQSVNPVSFTSLSAGSHTAFGTDVSGYTETAGTCTYAISGAECIVSSFSTPTCNGTSCSVPITVSSGLVTKVVFKYVVSPQCSNGADDDGDGKTDCNLGNEDPGCFPDGNGGGGSCNLNDNDETDINPIATLSASPSFILEGQSSTLVWSCANSIDGSIDQGVGVVCDDTPNSIPNCNPSGVTNGTKSIQPAATTLYTLICTGIDGVATAKAQATLQVGKIIEN